MSDLEKVAVCICFGFIAGHLLNALARLSDLEGAMGKVAGALENLAQIAAMQSDRWEEHEERARRNDG